MLPLALGHSTERGPGDDDQEEALERDQGARTGPASWAEERESDTPHYMYPEADHMMASVMLPDKSNEMPINFNYILRIPLYIMNHARHAPP